MSNKVPQIRFNGYSDAWEQRKLIEVVDVKSGRDYKHLSEGDIPVYGTGGYMLSVDEALSQNDDAIGIGRKGTIDNPYLLRAPFWTVDTLFYAIPRVGFDLNFTFDIFQKVNWRKLDESTGVPSLSKATINSVSAAVPSEDEQIKVGGLFEKIDNLIAANQRKLDLLKEQKKGYLQKMFPKNGAKVPELRFAGFADDWEERKLSNYITITGGNAWKSSDYSIGGDYLVVTIANVQGQRNINDKIGNKISVADPGKYLLKREDILVSLTGNVGRVSRMTDIPAVLNQRVGLVKPKTKKIDDEFLFQVLSNRRFESSMVASGQGAAQANISNNDVLSYELLVPQDVREQSIIAHFFRNFDNAIALHQRKLGLLKEQKKGFLQKMFV